MPCYISRQHGEALDEAETAIAINPNFAFGHFRVGQVRTYMGRAAEAVAPIERSIRHSPHDPQLGTMFTLLALAHYHAGNYKESLHNAEAAVHLRDVRAQALMAASFARLGRIEEARGALANFLPSPRATAVERAVPLAPYAKSTGLGAALCVKGTSSSRTRPHDAGVHCEPSVRSFLTG